MERLIKQINFTGQWIYLFFQANLKDLELQPWKPKRRVCHSLSLPVLCSEAVPLEAIITDQVTQLNLSAGAKKWSEKLLKMNFAERISSSTKVAEAGFDIQAVAERIEAKWRDEAFEASENIRHRPDI